MLLLSAVKAAILKQNLFDRAKGDISMGTGFDYVPPESPSPSPEALLVMRFLLNTIKLVNPEELSEKQKQEHILYLQNVLRNLRNYIPMTSSEKTSDSVSKTTSNSQNESSTESKYWMLNSPLLSESMKVFPCHLLLTSFSGLTADLKRGIINLFGISSTTTLPIYLHNFHCITPGFPCLGTHTRQYDTTRLDIVLPRKSKPIPRHVLTALHLGSLPNAYLLQWKNISK